MIPKNQLASGKTGTVVVANVVLDGRVGGPQRRIVLVGKELRAEGWDTVMVFPPMGQELPDFLADRGMPFASLPLSRIRLRNPLLSLGRYLLRLPREVWQLRKVYRRHGVRLVHANGLFSLQVALSAKLAGCRLVWHFNDMALPSWLCCIGRHAVAWLADARVYSGARVRKHYCDRPGPRSAILYPPVDLAVFDPSRFAGPPGPAIPALERRDGETLLVAVGHINPLKGYTYLIAALGLLVDLEAPWRLVVIGARLETNVEYYETVRQAVRDLGLAERVVLAGPSDRVAEAIAAADIAVISSVSESGPMVLLEAMALGKAVVATDVGIVDEVVRHGWNGLVVPPRDAGALAEALRQIIVDRDQRGRLAKQARASVTERFSASAAARDHARLYRQLMAGPRA